MRDVPALIGLSIAGGEFFDRYCSAAYITTQKGREFMTITLAPEIETLIAEQVGSGFYRSPEEVVKEAFRLLKEHAELRREIAIGAEQLKQGQYKDYDSVDELIEDIRARGQARLTAQS
jgi:putative addiction module CopG family antidote